LLSGGVGGVGGVGIFSNSHPYMRMWVKFKKMPTPPTPPTPPMSVLHVHKNTCFNIDYLTNYNAMQKV